MPQDANKLPRRTPLKNDTLAESVYAEVRCRLQRGEIGPDERLLDYDLATQFDCTRMPVRQALMRLVNEGYLQGTTRGFVVPVLSAEDVREIFAVRLLLEPAAAAEVAATISLEQQASMLRTFDKICKAYDEHEILALFQANNEFRSLWLEQVRNTRLKATIERFLDHVQQVRMRTLADRNTQAISIEALRKVLKGFLDRDANAVHTTMTAFIRIAQERYFALQHDDA
jgi:DNA-binding GntR family transcriptional regulator